MKNFFLISSLFFLLISCNEKATNSILVSNSSELNEAIKNAKAGDNITLKNGTYKDLEIVFEGEGTKDNPIILQAETAGKVFIECESSLKIGGNFLEVKGLLD